MTRLIGAVLVTAGGLFLGHSRGQGLLARRDLLRQAGEDLETAARLLEWQSPPLPELVEKLAAEGRLLSDLWRRCGQMLDSPDRPPFPELWKQAAEEACLPLSREETGLLLEAGRLLGQFHRQEQAAALSDLALRLRRAGDRVEEDWRRMNRVYCVLGGSGGLLAAILLM